MQFEMPGWLAALVVFFLVADRYILCWWTRKTSHGQQDSVNEHMFKAVETGLKAAEKSANQSAAVAGIMGKELQNAGTFALAVTKLMGNERVQRVYLPIENPESEEPDEDLLAKTGNSAQPTDEQVMASNGRFKRPQDM